MTRKETSDQEWLGLATRKDFSDLLIPVRGQEPEWVILVDHSSSQLREFCDSRAVQGGLAEKGKALLGFQAQNKAAKARSQRRAQEGPGQCRNSEGSAGQEPLCLQKVLLKGVPKKDSN